MKEDDSYNYLRFWNVRKFNELASAGKGEEAKKLGFSRVDVGGLPGLVSHCYVNFAYADPAGGTVFVFNTEFTKSMREERFTTPTPLTDVLGSKGAFLPIGLGRWMPKENLVGIAPEESGTVAGNAEPESRSYLETKSGDRIKSPLAVEELRKRLALICVTSGAEADLKLVM